MSFGGAVSAMISSLKGNSRRKERTHFNRKELKAKGSNEIYSKLLKRKATPEQLAEIRAKVKTEKRRVLIKTIVFTILLLMALYFGIKWLF
jgi:hypothetical protein